MIHTLYTSLYKGDGCVISQICNSLSQSEISIYILTILFGKNFNVVYNNLTIKNIRNQIQDILKDRIVNFV